MAAPTIIYKSGGGAVIPALLSVAEKLHLKDKLRIDKTFLPVKIVYFLLCAGDVCLLPFMSVYLAYVGLNPVQIGIAIGIKPFIGAIGSPLSGSLADKYHVHKCVLITCLVGVGLTYGSGVFLPFLNANVTVPWTNTSNESAPFEKQRQIVGVRLPTLCLDRAMDGSGCEQCDKDDVKKIDALLGGNELNRLSTKLGSGHNCTSEFPEAHLINGIGDEPPGGKDTTVVFPVSVVYLVLVQLFANSFSITDAMTMALVGEYEKRGQHAEYGRQRLWGAVSWGIIAPLAGLAIDLYSLNHPDSFNRYLIAFILCTSFYLLAVLPALLIPSPPRQPPASLSREVGGLLRKPHVLMFFLALFVSGVSIGVINTYLFLFLQQLSGSHTLMGLTKTLTCISEVPFLFFAAWLIKKLSIRGVFSLALFCFALRFTGYALLSDPWLVLPIELLHGITQGAMWPAAAAYVIVISPESVATTMQTLAYSVRLGLGRGVGILVGGVIFHHYGSRALFKAMAVVCGGTLAIYLPASAYFEKREAMRRLQVQYEEI